MREWSSEPRFEGLLEQLVCLAAYLSLSRPFLVGGSSQGEEEEDAVDDVGEARRKGREVNALWRGDGTSDALAVLRAAGAYSHARLVGKQGLLFVLGSSGRFE